jgi:dTDP-glucose 4,6-dehydratase
MRVLITGGAGFMGSVVIKTFLSNGVDSVVNIDMLSYAGSLQRLQEIESDSRYHFYRMDVADPELERILHEHRPTCVIHMAATTHVDRSIEDPQPFIQNNVLGTACLMESIRSYFGKLGTQSRNSFRLLHVSTDEIFGPAKSRQAVSEPGRYAPSSPYAASKAAANLLMHAWQRTYSLPTINIQSSNNFGPFQYPEKLIPKTIYNAVQNREIPVYGDGLQIRNWLYVEDFAKAIFKLMTKGKTGHTYNLCGIDEIENIELVEKICSLLDELRPQNGNCKFKDQIRFVEDRAGHDYRYAMDCRQTKSDLDWSATTSLAWALPATVSWYLDHLDWCNQVLQARI